MDKSTLALGWQLNAQKEFKVGFLGAWFITTILTLIFALILMFYLATPKIVEPNGQNFKLYAALPETNSEVSDQIGIEDGRAKILEDFFKSHNSPLAEFSKVFIDVADRYSLDYRLLPAISMQESNGGKRVIPSSHNPFGYGIYGSLVVKFQSWDEAIERVGKALRDDYLDKGLKNPDQIMAKYTPPSLEKEGAWAKGVNSFMEDLK